MLCAKQPGKMRKKSKGRMWAARGGRLRKACGRGRMRIPDGGMSIVSDAKAVPVVWRGDPLMSGAEPGCPVERLNRVTFPL